MDFQGSEKRALTRMALVKLILADPKKVGQGWPLPMVVAFLRKASLRVQPVCGGSALCVYRQAESLSRFGENQRKKFQGLEDRLIEPTLHFPESAEER
jgi:hypothetical protein